MNEKLKALIRELSGVKADEVKPEASILNDLGIDGDDAEDLIVAYGKAFNVNVSNFMLADYFNGEGLDLISALVEMVTGKSKPPKKPLLVRHLEKGIITGRLDEAVINN